jgi:predicted NBD/HSP70 family sugar kinase
VLPSGPPRRLRVLNDQAALAFILEAGVISRAELGRLTGLSKPGVAELLSRLERAGLIEKAGTMSGSGPGPAAQTWRVRPGVGFCAAADLTPTRWSVRVLDLDGTVVAAREDGWDAASPVEVLVRELRGTFAAAGLPLERLLSVAIGVPGAVDPRTGVVRGAPRLPELLGFDLAGAVSARLEVPVLVENDVNLMALAALADRVAERARSFAFVWIDEGLGAAIVRDGGLIRGFTGGAGEIDYVRIPVPAGGGADAGGKLGDLLSPAVLGPLEDALASAERPERGPEADAAEGVESVLRVLALGLASVVTVLDPELIVLGGRYGGAIGRWHVDALRHELAAVLETDLAFVPAIGAFAVDATTAINGAERVALDSARGIAFRSGSLTPTTDSPGHATAWSGDNH